jgi:hypothetical protein
MIYLAHFEQIFEYVDYFSFSFDFEYDLFNFLGRLLHLQHHHYSHLVHLE